MNNTRANTSTQSYRLGYIPALDGLRTIAVLAVIAYHMSRPWMAGGLLGVTMFFVLSGYLITSLLLQELGETGTINLPNFWLRRIRRLVPAIVLVVCVTAILCGLFNHGLLTKMRPDVIPSLLFVNNWWQIFHDVSYFDAMGAPSPLAHFWSLSIEEQFYLIWPVLLLVLYKAGVKKKAMRIITLALILASVLAMALLFSPGEDPSRVYYGTDTRAFSLLIGALLAFLWPAAQLRSSKKAANLPITTRIILDGIGCMALIGVIVMLSVADGMSPFLYRGGILLCSVLTAVVIAIVVHPSSFLGKIIGCKPMTWIGQRSYGMYLWHYPIILLLMPLFPGHTEPGWFLIIELALIIVVSALSYTFVEDPIRKGALRDAFSALRKKKNKPTYADAYSRKPSSKRNGTSKRAIPLLVSGTLIIIAAIVTLAVVPDEQYDENTKRLMEMQEQAESEARQAEIEANIARTKEHIANLQGNPAEWQLLFIGDSVLLGASDTLLERHPESIVDAAVSRSAEEAIAIYDYYTNQGWEGSGVVLSVGTNGPLYDTLDQMNERLDPDTPLFLVTVRDPHVDWEASNNDAIRSFAASRPNTYVIDWYSYSNNHDEYFYDDDTHLNEEGRAAFADLIDNTIRTYYPAQ